mmetsp:Transcript_11573/g.16723  ORF Transcript_11573/g.16723 Transcript_11573/m.16723 type:complete len:149 (-) Transcript_11573:1352-1798(-)
MLTEFNLSRQLQLTLFLQGDHRQYKSNSLSTSKLTGTNSSTQKCGIIGIINTTQFTHTQHHSKEATQCLVTQTVTIATSQANSKIRLTTGFVRPTNWVLLDSSLWRNSSVDLPVIERSATVVFPPSATGDPPDTGCGFLAIVFDSISL